MTKKTVWILARKDSHKFVGAFEYEHDAVDMSETLAKQEKGAEFEVFWVFVR